jgi:N-acetylglucosamine malate deacetylase 1
MSKTIMIVAAHTDDEALGCGGTIARHVAEGDIVYAVFMADGVSSRGYVGQNDHARRNVAAENARAILGIRENFYLGLPDNRLDSIPLIEVIQPLEEILHNLQPHIIYTHHHGDLNVDHRIVHQAVLTACRPMPGSCLQAIYAFEVMSSTEWATPMLEPFVPNHYVEISDYLNTKIDALRAYQLEMREAPHSRSFNHLECIARHRGHSVGVMAAEAFVTVRTLR